MAAKKKVAPKVAAVKPPVRIQVPEDQALAEMFKHELEALMAKYPSMRLEVQHSITIVELATK